MSNHGAVPYQLVMSGARKTTIVAQGMRGLLLLRAVRLGLVLGGAWGLLPLLGTLVKCASVPGGGLVVVEHWHPEKLLVVNVFCPDHEFTCA